MKTIWIILLVMVLFNGFLLAFNIFFTQSPGESATDISNDPSLSAYKTPGQIGISLADGMFAGTTSLISFLVGGALAVFSKNLQYLAAGALVSLISGLWITTSAVFSNMLQYAVVSAIYTIVSLAIGIIVAILVLGIFTGQDQTTW